MTTRRFWVGLILCLHGAGLACDESPAAPSRDTGPADGAGLDGAGGDGADDRLRILASNQSNPTALAVSDEAVFWLNREAAGSVMRVAKSGGQPERLAESVWPNALAVDDFELFWGDDAGLWSVGLGGGTATLMVPDAGVDAVALTGDFVYWVDHDGDALYRLSRDEGEPERLAAGSTELPSALVVDRSRVYWINRLAGELLSASLDGEDPEVLAGWAGDNTTVLVGDEDRLFWPNAATGELLSIPKLGGDAGVLADIALLDLAVDAGHVYLTAPADHAVLRVATTGGVPETLVTGDEPWDVAATADGIYWTDVGAGTVAVLPRTSSDP